MFPKIISDTPAENDKFNAHKKIAFAINNIIENQEGGKTIGLEGNWGSGKSTIVKIISSIHSPQKKITTFNFDAWVHQGEPLRRVFLESLINHFIDLGWLTKDRNEKNYEGVEFWIKLKEKLSGNLKESTKKTIPAYTNLTKIFLPLLLLMPLGFSLISVGARETKKQLWTLSNHSLVIGLIITILPFFCVIASLVLSKLKGEKTDDMWNLFLKKTETSETIEIIGEKESTSIEFQENFDMLLESALEYENRKLVIILDNLDRVDGSELKEVWSILRSFIANSSFSKRAWFQKLWVIIPYSREKLKSSDLESVQENNNPSSHEHFLEKSFQIKFYVPPLNLSIWKTHLFDLLCTAFSEKIASSEKHAIYLLCAKEMGMETAPPSPRRLLTFVNSLVAVDLQWEKIPISHKALYIILREKYSSDTFLEKLISGEIPSKANIQLLGKDIESSIGGLFFNVNKNIANQILLDKKIKASLEDRSGITLKNNYNQTGFPEIFSLKLKNYIDEIKKENSDSFINTMFSIFNSEIFQKNNYQEKIETIKALGILISGISYWPIENPDSIPSIKKLMEMDDSKIIKNEIVSSIYKMKNWLSENDGIFPNTISLDKMKKLEDFLSNEIFKNYFSEEEFPKISISVDEEGWVKLYCRSIKTKANINFDMFSVNFGNNNLYSYAINNNEKLNSFEITCILNYLIKNNYAEIGNFIEILGTKLISETSIRKDGLPFIIPFLLSFTKKNATTKNFSASINAIFFYISSKWFAWDLEDTQENNKALYKQLVDMWKRHNTDCETNKTNEERKIWVDKIERIIEINKENLSIEKKIP